MRFRRKTRRSTRKGFRRGTRRSTKKRTIVAKLSRGIVQTHYPFNRTCTILAPNSYVYGTNSTGCGQATTVDGSYVTESALALPGPNYFAAAIKFQINQLPSYTDFANLFERYRINHIDVVITPFSTTADLQSSGNQSSAFFLHSVIDTDDADPPTTADASGVDELRERPSYRMINCFQNMGRPLRWRVRPKIAMPAYGGGIFSSYTHQSPQWIDWTSPAVEHYGLKLMFETFCPVTALSFWWFKIEAEYFFECADKK